MLFLALVGTFVAHVQVNIDDDVFICRGGERSAENNNRSDVTVKDDGCDGDIQQVVTRLVCGCPAFYWAAAGTS